MKKILLFIAFLSFAPQAYAKTTSTVKVNTNVSTSGDSTSSVKNDITVETNGKVTHYSSDKSENIEINSVDGVSEIKVNGEEVLGDNSQSNSDVESSPTPTDGPEDDNNGTQEETKSLFEKFVEIIEKIFFFLR